MGKTAKNVDLSHEPARASYGQPASKTGEVVGMSGSFKIKIPRSVIHVAEVGGIASFAHFVLAMGGLVSLIMGLVIVISIVTADNHPQYATSILKPINQLAKKMKIK